MVRACAWVCAGILLCAVAAHAVEPGHSLLVADTGLNKVILFSAEGKVVWEHPALACHDVSALPSGNILFCDCGKERSAVREVTRENKVVFEYETDGEVFSCQRMTNGNTLIGCGTAAMLLEVTPEGKVAKTIHLKSEAKGHGQMRLARATPWGTYLVAHMGDKAIREYNDESEVVREVKTEATPNGVAPLANKNVLISTQTEIFELAPDGAHVWILRDSDIPEAGPAWMAGIRRLPNGNTLVSNWLGHGKDGTGYPVFEVAPDKKIVWKFTDTKQTKWVASAQYVD